MEMKMTDRLVCRNPIILPDSYPRALSHITDRAGRITHCDHQVTGLGGAQLEQTRHVTSGNYQ